jgi:hypothetical protein
MTIPEPKQLRTLISGVVKRIDDTPWASATVRFRLVAGSYTSDGNQHPPDKTTITTDADGRFSTYLWANESGMQTTQYEVVLKGETFKFSIPPGLTEAKLTTLIRRSNTPDQVDLEPDEDEDGDVLRRTELFLPSPGQTTFLLLETPVSPELSVVYLNGIKSIFATEYVINTNILVWNGVDLEPTDFLEIIYYI